MSDQGYIQLAFVLDVTTLVETGYDYMETGIPDWTPDPAAIDTIMVDAAGQIAGELYDQAREMPPEAIAYIGTSIYGIPMEDGAPAVADAVFTFAEDTPAIQIDEDTPVMVPHPTGESVIFLTDRDIVAPAGGGDVALQLVAEENGSAANGAFGQADLVDPVEGLAAISVSEALNGTNPETAVEYLDRLSSLLTTLSFVPILPQDHATLAAQDPEVERATAIDLLIPGTTESPTAIRDPNEPQPPPADNQTDQARTTTVAIKPVGAEVPSNALMQRVWDLLNDSREVNFLNFVIPPTYTTIDVRATVRGYPGVSDDDAAAAAQAMVTGWLDPSTYGSSPGPGWDKTWTYDTLIRHDEAVDYINRATGVWYSKNVEMKESSGSVWTSGDISLSGVAPLPRPGTITITPENP